MNFCAKLNANKMQTINKQYKINHMWKLMIMLMIPIITTTKTTTTMYAYK